MDLDVDGEIAIASFELPGLCKQDISIEVHNGVLIISGEKTKHFKPKEGFVHHLIHERHYGKFVRTLQLPAKTAVSTLH